MNEKEKIKKIIKVFADNTKCDIQYNGCPCNSCFHSQEGDFKHICWLIILLLRGDYDNDANAILNDIKEELKEVEK